MIGVVMAIFMFYWINYVTNRNRDCNTNDFVIPSKPSASWLCDTKMFNSFFRQYVLRTYLLMHLQRCISACYMGYWCSKHILNGVLLCEGQCFLMLIISVTVGLIPMLMYFRWFWSGLSTGLHSFWVCFKLMIYRHSILFIIINIDTHFNNSIDNKFYIKMLSNVLM